jgi:glycosyltransferase involved in cell wall biosynthesis
MSSAAPAIAVGAVACDPTVPGGLNRYTTELLPRLLESDGAVYAYGAAPALRSRTGGDLRMVSLPALARGDFVGNFLRMVWHQTALPADLKRRGARLFYSPVADGMLFPVCPQVTSVPDLIPLLFPESSPRLKYYYKHVLPRIVRASAAVITLSQASREDIRRLYGLEEERIHVVYPGYPTETFRPGSAERVDAVRRRHGLGDYVLSVGETRPYKNVPRLLEAFSLVRRPALKLVVVGRHVGRGIDLRSLARSLGIEDRVVLLGTVADDELAALYSGARAFAFPSLYEGFGIPALEAMACGCPVLASRAASLPEVCGDAALYIDPYDTRDIAQGLEQMLSDPALRASLSQRGLLRAARFSYGETARQVMAVLRACKS